MVSKALVVISQHLDHSAVFNAATAALFDHAFKLCFQGFQLRNSSLDLCQLVPGDNVSGCTRLVWIIGQAEQLAYSGE
jgi:hypothetical protein|tara:strand:- start:6892 stop:7125 length:234 start_codon:yes stop_codon:yes gene_type:complete